MNVHNDINGTFELSPRNQFEMQSCKVNETGSRPNIALKRIGQKLDEAETKCFTLKSELNYVMEVCQKAQTEIRGSKESSDISPISSSKNSGSKSPVGHNDNSEITDKIKNCDFPQRIYNAELKDEDNYDTFNLSPKSAQFSFRKSIGDDDIIERSESLIEGNQKGILNVTITPRIQLDKKLPRSITTMPTQNSITEVSKEYENYYSLSPLPSHMSFEKLTSQAKNYFRLTPRSTRSVKDVEDVKDPGLNLEISSVAKIKRVRKNKSRTGRSEISSVGRIDNAMSKGRKRKKLRSSMSKSTVTTKGTGFIGRKETKKRRHRGHNIVHQQSNPKQHLKKFNDVVEIFHNTKLKNNNCGIFSKRMPLGSNKRTPLSLINSKVDEAKHEKKSRLPETKEAQRKIQETSALSPENRNPERPINRECQSRDKKNEKDQCRSHDKKNEGNYCRSHDKKNQQDLQTLNDQNHSEATPEVTQEQNKSEKQSSDLGPSAKDETQQCERAFSRYDDPMFTPSYEMPTLASKLKRSSRSYFSRFNFRNIPFVVGTSVTPSHNLGLNIQQVLSVMKTRQPNISGVTPLLIRKVSQGIRPMSILLDQINGHYEGSVLNVSSQMSGTFNKGENLGQNKRLSAFNLQHKVEKTQNSCMAKVPIDEEITSERGTNVSNQLCKEKSDSCNRKTKQQSSSAVSKSDTYKNQQGISGISLKSNIARDSNITDHKVHIPNSHNSKEIREVLINLHDQFEEMNTKYERLQLEVEKSSDKSLAKELSTLEKELSAKEEEINAVVSLYKEVMTLKQQMKMLHERNSLVCIATESAKDARKNPFPFAITPGKSHSMNPVIFGRGKIYNAAREPPASMQLAALLRQIQTFHKQLQLVS
ncbi:uncharacterized protein LOC105838113 [Monomorium pharaonis]|uniref:uncharacterized protein LOC105838113 n=1 Tax=Monomorium pharaonis TaxID=307658 RepID=UPI0017472F90|nr:uncharacterized protein LOC105838113 [Monomorium pharaonis]